MYKITNNDDIIDSRDIIERIEELESGCDEDAAELLTLQKLAEEASDYCEEWIYGATLVRDSYFVDYARELADDIGAINSDNHWPLYCIDWDQAARDLKMDYTPVNFDGVTYWVR